MILDWFSKKKTTDECKKHSETKAKMAVAKSNLDRALQELEEMLRSERAVRPAPRQE